MATFRGAFPLAEYRHHLLVDLGIGSFTDSTSESQAWQISGSNLLTQILEVPMYVYPASAVIHPRCGGKPLISRSLPKESGRL